MTFKVLLEGKQAETTVIYLLLVPIHTTSAICNKPTTSYHMLPAYKYQSPRAESQFLTLKCFKSGIGT
jgi:hypothetical protein